MSDSTDYMPLALRTALVKQLEDASFAYGRSAIRDANMVIDAIEELLTLHPDAEAHRTLVGWWLRQFEEQGIEPCFCIYHAETGERTDNPQCPRHRRADEPIRIDGWLDARVEVAGPVARRFEGTHNDGDALAITRLREVGCECPRPLVGERPGLGPRCRLCNTEATWTDDDLRLIDGSTDG